MQQPFDPLRFRQALGAFPTGVTVVTTRDAAGQDAGLTANSFNSVSLAPPLVLWSLARDSRLFDAFMAAGHFAVHVLSIGQQALAERFARRGADRFAGLDCRRGAGDAPLFDGCAARFECRTTARHDGGDHVVLLGEVLRFEHSGLEPLLYARGRYAQAIDRPA